VQHTTPIILIAAIGKNNELGKNNDLLWRLKSDMSFFKSTTNGHWVIMGRKSWESLPPRFRPLPNRENCVVSRNIDFTADGAHVFSNLTEAIDKALASNAENIFIIGGAQIYTESLNENLIDEMYLTHVDASFSDADVFFPAIEKSHWDIREVGHFEADDANEYSGTFFHYRKKHNDFKP
jgi:dihydrofolate reductase